jgi:hemoglobin-like flavoprotein
MNYICHISSSFKENHPEDPYIILFRASNITKFLKRYLSREYSSENLEFIMNTLKYEAINNEALRKPLAKKILKEYIAAGGKKQVDITDWCLRKITEETENAPPWLFSIAKMQVLNTLKRDSLGRIFCNISRIIYKSWGQIVKIYPYLTFGIKLCKNLLRISPKVEELFPLGLDPAGFTKAIEVCIYSITDLKKLSNIVRAVARGHKSCGCTKSHVKLFSKPFFLTLKSCSHKWNSELEEAWFFAYKVIECFFKHWLPEKDVRKNPRCTIL